MTRLSQSVTTVDSQVGTGDILGSVTEQEGDGTHEVFGGTHLADGDERGPLLLQFGVLIEDLARSNRHVSKGKPPDSVNGTYKAVIM